jgi:hypothetical protein
VADKKPNAFAGATKQPIDKGLIARAASAFSVLTGKQKAVDLNDVWFGPNDPLPQNVPQQQLENVVGRQFDYPAGYNVRMRPRADENISFAQMRALADSCDILRLVIETRKDQLAKLKFKIAPRDEDKDPDNRCKEITDFFACPDGQHTWVIWLRALVEEMLVTDAACIYPWMLNGGKPYRFDLMDGTTIKRVLDARGRTPAPPQPAYQQILKGITAVNYTSDELIYQPRNIRVHKVYGYSPVEQVIMTVNIAIRRALSQLQYYTDGSTADLIFQVPPEWNMTQIKEFNDWWQDSLSGNSANRRKAQFVPHGVIPFNTKDALLKDAYDEWLARIICYCFSVSPQALVKEMNRATAETAHAQALQEGLAPLLVWVKGIADMLILKYFKAPDLEFIWNDEEEVDANTQSQIDDRAIKNGSEQLNEIRKRRGLPPLDLPEDKPMVLTATGFVPIVPDEPAPGTIDPVTGLAVPVPGATATGLDHPMHPLNLPTDPAAPPGKGGAQPPSKGVGASKAPAKGEGKGSPKPEPRSAKK